MNKIPESITNLLEISIQRFVALDPAAISNIKKLDNKAIELVVKELSLPVYFKIDDSVLKISSTIDREPDSKIKASLPALLKMSISNDGDESILGSDFEMTGDMETGRQFRNIFKELDIDWEEIMSKYTGDIVAHKVGNGVRSFKSWTSATNDTLRQDIAEFLQEESRQLPSKYEVNNFLQLVDDMRQSVDRAEARVKKLNPGSKEPSKKMPEGFKF